MTDKENQLAMEKGREWRLPAFQDQVRSAGLYIVATPIGNLGDISIRALDTLCAVDVVLCEDTRVSGKLMSHYGVDAKLETYNDHSDAGKRGAILSRIHNGTKFALISDAGMPLISDPGYKLVSELIEVGCFVTSISGANAPLSALQLSGMPSDAFSFIGFLPSKAGARRAYLEAWAGAQGSLLMFESANRLKASLKDIHVVFHDRRVAVVREISKKFESVVFGSAAELLELYEAEGLPKGEIVLVIEPPRRVVFKDEDIDALLKDALLSKGTKEAAALVASQTGLKKSDLYDLALKIAKSL
ncbi:MAG: 16S rRNA (cytidine(1402)-2'-O)-methyltransferase [Bdellovibrionales bacterium]